jgi:hypothetical protein
MLQARRTQPFNEVLVSSALMIAFSCGMVAGPTMRDDL